MTNARRVGLAFVGVGSVGAAFLLGLFLREGRSNRGGATPPAASVAKVAAAPDHAVRYYDFNPPAAPRAEPQASSEAASPVASAEEPIDRPSPAEVRARALDRLLVIQEAVAAEPRATTWATANEQVFQSFMRSEFGTAKLEEVSCRTALCSFEVRLKDRVQYYTWQSRTYDVLGTAGLSRGSILPTFNDDGSVSVEAFFAKEGHSIPGGPWQG